MPALTQPLLSFAERLIDWQQKHGRHDLPWQQKASDPNQHAYQVWVSEVMLQQTQVQTVVPYFLRWMSKFPNLTTLACAREDEVLALWSGLGYYRRARYLHACAREIQQNHGGRFPASADQLAALPGIGRSTAAAIASTVFGERVAILDGNVKRVLARHTAAQAPWQSAELERSLWREAELRLPHREVSRYTQAIMDLGAMVCKPRNPQCDRCPVALDCMAYITSSVSLYPRPKFKQAPKQLTIFWAVFVSEKGVWLERQPLDGLWPGLWTPWRLSLDAPPEGWFEKGCGPTEHISMRHQLTHRRLEIEAGVFHWPRRLSPSPKRNNLRHFGWGEVPGLALPKPASDLLAKLGQKLGLALL